MKFWYILIKKEPEEWDRLNPLCKTGQNQSPINIDTSKVIRPPESNLHFHFHFVNYDEIVPSFVSNNGNSCNNLLYM